MNELKDQNLVCFAKDWSEESTCCNHILRELAKNNRILWLNSIATRAPSLGSSKDLKKIATKLRAFTKGYTNPEPNIWVYTPIVIPNHSNPFFVWVNQQIIKTSIAMIRRRLGMKTFHLWSFVPTASEYVGVMGEEASVYYCTDEWSMFSFVKDPAEMEAKEAKLCKKVDIIFATAETLAQRKKVYNPNTHTMPHGVDYCLFSRALEADTPTPEDIAAIPGPIIGFYGTVQDWIDFDLLRYLAEKHPEWSFVLLGKVFVDISAFDSLPNVHFLGKKHHSELPLYCKHFSVGIIPYANQERMKYVNPVKLREYLSAGLPVVATSSVPELSYFPETCAVSSTHEEFERNIAAALAADSPEKRRQRSLAMQNETWTQKALTVGRLIVETIARKRAA